MSRPATKWLTADKLAALRGVSGPAIRQSMKAMAARGSPVQTRRQGRAILIDVADYTEKRASLIPYRVQGEATKRAARGSSTEPADPVFLKEQARKVAAEARLKELELGRQRGELIDADAVRQAATDCGANQGAMIDRIAMRAEDVYAAGKHGVAGVRGALRSIARDLKKSMGEALAGAVAPCTDNDADDGE
jgi:hypothetical protein